MSVNRKSFDEYVQIALQARESKDSMQWVLGDIANEVNVFYGEDSIGKLAQEVGIKKSSLMTYRMVSRAFPPAKRISEIPFTQHQVAASTDRPDEWLHKAVDGNWTVEKLTYEIKATKDPVGTAQNEQKLQAAVQYLKNMMNQFIRGGQQVDENQSKNIVNRVIELMKRGR